VDCVLLTWASFHLKYYAHCNEGFISAKGGANVCVYYVLKECVLQVVIAVGNLAELTENTESYEFISVPLPVWKGIERVY